MRRLGIGVNYGILKIELESYFAITSNTVQFGANLSAAIKVGKFGVYGYFGFDALFQFKPFYFMFNVRAGVSVKWGNKTLFSITLEMDLQGPGPWNAKGAASFKILFIKVKIKFDVTWGKKQGVVEKHYVDVYPLLAVEYRKPENWTIISQQKSESLVKLLDSNKDKSTKEFVMEPYDGLQFEQSVLPLNKKINRFGEETPLDFEKIEWIEISIGTVNAITPETAPTKTDFAPSLFVKMSDNEKLKSPSYEKMQNGIKITGSVNDCKVSKAQHYQNDYEAEQDTIYFSGNGFKVENVVNEYLKEINYYEVEQNKPAADKDTIRGKGREFTFVQKVARRSDNSFKRHANRLQKSRVGALSDQINNIYEMVSPEKGFRIVSKTTNKELQKEIKALSESNTFTSTQEAIQKLQIEHPELKNQLFISYDKRTVKR
jgi:hypothetical protein